MNAPAHASLTFGSYVHHRLFGHGQITSNDKPIVRFLDGRESEVDLDDLRLVTIGDFERQLAVRACLNAALIIRVHGAEAMSPDGQIWRRDELGLWTTTDTAAPWEASNAYT